MHEQQLRYFNWKFKIKKVMKRSIYFRLKFNHAALLCCGVETQRRSEQLDSGNSAFADLKLAPTTKACAFKLSLDVQR